MKLIQARHGYHAVLDPTPRLKFPYHASSDTYRQKCVFLRSYQESSTPLSLRPFHSSGSKNLLTVTSSARPFLLLVLRTKSLAAACGLAISSGRSFTSRSSGSPGTTSHLSKTKLTVACPCV